MQCGVKVAQRNVFLWLRAALALARSGRTTESEEIVHHLAAAYPSHTLLNSYWLPTIRAALELNHKNPTKAIELLRTAEPYELGSGKTLYPAHVRGEAYMRLGRGKEAAAEFQKSVNYRGMVQNFLLGH